MNAWSFGDERDERENVEMIEQKAGNEHTIVCTNVWIWAIQNLDMNTIKSAHKRSQLEMKALKSGHEQKKFGHERME